MCIENSKTMENLSKMKKIESNNKVKIIIMRFNNLIIYERLFSLQINRERNIGESNAKNKKQFNIFRFSKNRNS